MKHQIKKIKFRGGKDANTMLVRKMCSNFISHGTLTTTQAKAKMMKSVLDTLIAKTGERTEGNKNYMLRILADAKLVDRLFTQLGPKTKDIKGGYVTLRRDKIRMNDGSQMVQVTWAHDLGALLKTVEEPKKDTKTVKALKPAAKAKPEKKEKSEAEAKS